VDAPLLHRTLLAAFSTLRWSALATLPKDIEFFSGFGHTQHIHIMKSCAAFESVLLGKWSLADLNRLRILDFCDTASAPAWDTAPSPASRRQLLQHIKDYQRVVVAVWGPSFIDVFAPFVDLFEKVPNPIPLIPAAYMAARFEYALHEFHTAASSTAPSEPFGTRRTSAQGCADILRSLITSAAHWPTWEPFPCSGFFAPEGEYESLFSPSKKRPLPGSVPIIEPAVNNRSDTKGADTRNKQPRRDATVQAVHAPPRQTSSIAPPAPLLCFAQLIHALKIKNPDIVQPGPSV
jgi:hypothetical protein